MPTAARSKQGTRQRGPTEKSMATRQRILGEAAKLFAKQGYHGTGVAELSAAVGLGAGALYHHIGSKEQLLFEICRTHIEEVVELGEQLLDADDLSARDKLQRLARKHMQNVAERSVELRVTLREIDSLTGKRHRQMQALRDRTEQIWEQVVDQGRKSGELDGIDPLFVKVALAALNYSVLWYRADGALRPDEIADRTIALMLDPPNAAEGSEAAPGRARRRGPARR
jgi:TetR/AcrR family transcriptional regulator, cholesterol catabolism regulator